MVGDTADECHRGCGISNGSSGSSSITVHYYYENGVRKRTCDQLLSDAQLVSLVS